MEAASSKDLFMASIAKMSDCSNQIQLQCKYEHVNIVLRQDLKKGEPIL